MKFEEKWEYIKRVDLGNDWEQSIPVKGKSRAQSLICKYASRVQTKARTVCQGAAGKEWSMEVNGPFLDFGFYSKCVGSHPRELGADKIRRQVKGRNVWNSPLPPHWCHTPPLLLLLHCLLHISLLPLLRTQRFLPQSPSFMLFFLPGCSLTTFLKVDFLSF